MPRAKSTGRKLRSRKEKRKKVRNSKRCSKCGQLIPSKIRVKSTFIMKRR